MTISELYKILEEAVKENPQGIVYFDGVNSYFNEASSATVDEDGDLILE